MGVLASFSPTSPTYHSTFLTGGFNRLPTCHGSFFEEQKITQLLVKNTDNFCLLQHDSGTECTPGESKNLGQKENGNYIMYARATSGDKLNNNKFSICSIRNISQVLEKKRNNCFVGMYFFYTIWLSLFFMGWK